MCTGRAEGGRLQGECGECRLIWTGTRPRARAVSATTSSDTPLGSLCLSVCLSVCVCVSPSLWRCLATGRRADQPALFLSLSLTHSLTHSLTLPLTLSVGAGTQPFSNCLLVRTELAKVKQTTYDLPVCDLSASLSLSLSLALPLSVFRALSQGMLWLLHRALDTPSARR